MNGIVIIRKRKVSKLSIVKRVGNISYNITKYVIKGLYNSIRSLIGIFKVRIFTSYFKQHKPIYNSLLIPDCMFKTKKLIKSNSRVRNNDKLVVMNNNIIEL